MNGNVYAPSDLRLYQNNAALLGAIDECPPPPPDKTRLSSPSFQPFAHNCLSAGHGGLIVIVDQLQAQASDILIVRSLAHHLVGEDLFTTP
jgi:hypothetical protein